MLPDENRQKLKELCQTRWVERHEYARIFCESTNTTIKGNCDSASRRDYASVRVSLLQSEVLYAIDSRQEKVSKNKNRSKKTSNATKGLSVKLQGQCGFCSGLPGWTISIHKCIRTFSRSVKVLVSQSLHPNDLVGTASKQCSIRQCF